jgi:hypothetical protein
MDDGLRNAGDNDYGHYADFVLPESRMINDSQRYNQNLLKKGVWGLLFS